MLLLLLLPLLPPTKPATIHQPGHFCSCPCPPLPATGLQVRKAFMADRAAGKTLVVATHNLSLAAELGERCVVLGQEEGILFDGPIQTALSDLPLLERAGLAHRHIHVHDGVEHVHLHAHDWQ